LCPKTDRVIGFPDRVNTEPSGPSGNSASP
jgi:hypothetical protein